MNIRATMIRAAVIFGGVVAGCIGGNIGESMWLASDQRQDLIALNHSNTMFLSEHVPVVRSLLEMENKTAQDIAGDFVVGASLLLTAASLAYGSGASKLPRRSLASNSFFGAG